MDRCVTTRITEFTANVVFASTALLMGCSGAGGKGAEVVYSTFPGAKLTETFVSPDGEYFCGRVRSDFTFNQAIKFYAKWREKTVVYEGDGQYSFPEYANKCGVAYTGEELTTEAAHVAAIADLLAGRLKEEDLRARPQSAERRRAEWLRENADAIMKLDEAQNKAFYQRPSGR